MYKSSYKKTFRIPKLILILTGVWPKHNAGFLYKIYGFITSILLPVAFIVPSLLDVSLDPDHIAEGSYSLFCSLTVISYSGKLITFLTKSKLFQKILLHLNEPIFTSYENEFEIHMEKTILLSAIVRNLLYYPCIAFVSFMAGFPALDRTRKRPLPFNKPFDMSRFPFWCYCLVYFMDVIAAAICAGLNASMDVLACSLIALGTAQLEILAAKLQRLGRNLSARRDRDNCDQSELVKCELKMYVRHHIAIIEYMKMIEEMYGSVYFIQFLQGLIVIGVTGFSFIVIPFKNVLFGAAVSYFIAAMVEISMYCVFGDDLIVKICKTSYSYFTLLRRMYGMEEY